LWFSLGTVSDNLGKLEEAEAAYLKAVEVKPDYFDANYNLGAMYFNQGVQKIKLANEIPPRENAKYKAMVDKANADFEKALPYLERAFELDGQDQSTIKSLRDIYARTGNDEGLLKMSKLLEGK
ncbi:MAG: tetratricopeptide repeat protein, partial [Flavobacteriales bacterium]|nr:tetratricopeptide repeat protein [Flavobacteriales bacterium]